LGQFNIGFLYDNAKGVDQDYAQALSWYRKAAEQGNARAQFAIGALFENGDGVKQDNAQAMYWYRKAAEQGHEPAKAAALRLSNFQRQ